MTQHLVNWIGKQAAKRTFSSIAEEAGITEGYALYSPTTPDEENTKNYGAEISTLAKLIEADKL